MSPEWRRIGIINMNGTITIRKRILRNRFRLYLVSGLVHGCLSSIERLKTTVESVNVYFYLIL